MLFNIVSKRVIKILSGEYTENIGKRLIKQSGWLILVILALSVVNSSLLDMQRR